MLLATTMLTGCAQRPDAVIKSYIKAFDSGSDRRIMSSITPELKSKVDLLSTGEAGILEILDYNTYTFVETTDGTNPWLTKELAATINGPNAKVWIAEDPDFKILLVLVNDKWLVDDYEYMGMPMFGAMDTSLLETP